MLTVRIYILGQCSGLIKRGITPSIADIISFIFVYRSGTSISFRCPTGVQPTSCCHVLYATSAGVDAHAHCQGRQLSKLSKQNISLYPSRYSCVFAIVSVRFAFVRISLCVCVCVCLWMRVSRLSMRVPMYPFPLMYPYKNTFKYFCETSYDMKAIYYHRT